MTKIVATSSKTTQFEPVPAGNYPARCYSMVHIGTVEEEFQGEKKMQNKVRLTFELPTEKRVFKEEKGEQPIVLSKEYTLSLHEKSNLRKTLESWRGKGFSQSESEAFDISVLVGKPCMLNVIHTEKNGNTYANIASISAMPKGFECPPQINKSVLWSVSEFNSETFETFPDFLKDKIKSSVEYKKMINPHETEVHEDVISSDDLPF